MKLLTTLSAGCLLLLSAAPMAFAQEPPKALSTTGLAPASPVEVWGHERLTWDQQASEPEALADLTFTAYVDGLFDLLENVTCSRVRTDFGFECSSRLPRMVAGTHSIVISATHPVHGVSARSAPLMVHLHSRTADGAPLPHASRVGGFTAEQVIGAMVDVADIAALPDGRVLVGEERGRILTVGRGKAPVVAFDLRTVDRSPAAIKLLAVAVGTDFSDSHAVYAAYMTQRGLRLVRFTEANSVLLNHAVLRDGLPIVESEPKAALALGPDQKVYLAVTGQVLRINLDGSTPIDGVPTGVFAAGVSQPEGIAWSIDQRVMWVLGSTPQGGSELRAVALGDRGLATTLRAYELSEFGGTALVVGPHSSRDGNGLIVATRATNDLLQWRTELPGALDRPSWLTGLGLGEITAIVDAGDGRVWIASRTGIFRVGLPR